MIYSMIKLINCRHIKNQESCQKLKREVFLKKKKNPENSIIGK